MKTKDYYLAWAREMLRLARDTKNDSLHKGWLKAAAAYEGLAEKAESGKGEDEKRD